MVDQIRHSEPGIKLGQIKPALNCDQGFFSVTQRGIKRNSCNCINEEILFGNRDSSCFCETSFITHIGGLDLLFLSFIVKKQYNETSNIIFYHTAAATTSGTIRIATAFSLDQHRGMCTISVTQYCMKLKKYENSQLSIIDQV